MFDFGLANIAQVGNLIDPNAAQQFLLLLITLAENGLIREVISGAGQDTQGGTFEIAFRAFQNDNLIELTARLPCAPNLRDQRNPADCAVQFCITGAEIRGEPIIDACDTVPFQSL